MLRDFKGWGGWSGAVVLSCFLMAIVTLPKIENASYHNKAKSRLLIA